MSKSKHYYMIIEINIGVKLYSYFYPNLFLRDIQVHITKILKLEK